MSTSGGSLEMFHGVRARATLTNGWLRGIGLLSVVLLVTVASPAQDEQPSPDAVKFKTLVNFDGANGVEYLGNTYPVQGLDGNLYGLTLFGGANTCGGPYCGTFFKMTPAGKLTTVYSFCAQPNCADGLQPNATVALGTDGNFYGTTEQGGACGNGTVFKVTSSGQLTPLYSFCPDYPNCVNGDVTFAGVVEGIDGNFYGVTPGGGANTVGPCGMGVGPVGCGTVFRVTPEGAFTRIYSFCNETGCSDGAGPASGLLAAADGELYGITGAGGANGSGTIFRITPWG
jgi:uncharacterized repeat protein (TIGR03803 family)